MSAQLLKIILSFIVNKKIKLSLIWKSGGMPSSHSATVSALVTATGTRYGWTSTSFAVSFILALVVVYDAVGVRQAVGTQAKFLNQLQKKMAQNGYGVKVNTLQEKIGHSLLEAVLGIILGIFVSGVILFSI